MNLAIILPRYGEQIVGGAETLARTLAEHAIQREWHVTVLTTCARNHHTWENHFSEGTTKVNGLTICRFPITPWDSKAHNHHNLQLNTRFSINDQYHWLSSGPHSPDLYTHIQKNKEHYDVVLALPYLSTIVQYAAWVIPEKTLMIPCLHEEIYAWIEPLHLLLRTVQGVLFLTPEEQNFALNFLQLTPKHFAIFGAGLNDPPEHLPTITLPNMPYIMAVSRLERGKNLALLYEYVQRYVDDGGKLKLFLTGTGDFTPPTHPAFELLGFVTHEEKLAWMQSALALCQPSLMESFSIVIMESWQMGRPVLVHKDCAVTTGHVKRSSAGLSFASYQEFADVIDWFKTNPKETNLMGERGKQYVFNNYRWPLLFSKLESFVEDIL